MKDEEGFDERIKEGWMGDRQRQRVAQREKEGKRESDRGKNRVRERGLIYRVSAQCQMKSACCFDEEPGGAHLIGATGG